MNASSPDRGSKPEPPDDSRFGVLSLWDPRRSFSRLAIGFMVSSVGDPFSLAISLVIVYSTFHSTFAIAAAYGARAAAALLVGGSPGRSRIGSTAAGC